MYEGVLVRLRAYQKEEMVYVKDLINRSEIKKCLALGIPFPYTLEDELKFYESISANNDTYTFAIEAKETEELIGGCGTNAIDWKNSTATVGIFVGKEGYLSKGYGTDAMNILINFIFNEMNINKVKLEVYSFNIRAIKCYEKLGFKQEGCLRKEIFREGKYHDILVYGMFRDEFKF
jgi:RimJ/RimL family protein N-acetyltransferase